MTMSLGYLLAEAVMAGGTAIAKGMVSPAAKDLYNTLKARIMRLGAKPDDPAPEIDAEIAKTGKAEQSELAQLAQELLRELRESPLSAPAVDIGRLKAVEVDLGTVIAHGKTALKADEIETGTFRINTLRGGEPPGEG
ncbi:hypothetical protein KHP62_13915 [Rhodobacteraceae bacterium NNCM2]|nr:hypothetical protein [Coraliihabitans acroporae]